MNAFIQFFGEHLKRLPTTYEWAVRPKTKAGLPNFQWHPTSGTMDECIAMKQHLTTAWNKAEDNERQRLAHWIVADWGGVRANNPATIAQYVSNFAGDTFNTRLKGIASYSKILSVVNCLEYAIYDARVAAALNAVQVLYDPREQFRYFAHVPSRNTVIKNFISWFAKNELGKPTWERIPYDATYTEYKQLLHDLKNHFPTYEVYHFEMVLFSMAPCLCERAMKVATLHYPDK